MSEMPEAPIVPTDDPSAGADPSKSTTGACPHANGNGRAPFPAEGGGNSGWWPHRLNVKILAKNPAEASPLG